MVNFILDSILLQLEGGCYVGPIPLGCLRISLWVKVPALLEAKISKSAAAVQETVATSLVPMGGLQGRRCDTTCTFPPCNFGKGRTCRPLWHVWYSQHCMPMLFARNGTYEVCFGMIASTKTCMSPSPQRWRSPSPGYSK